MRCHRCVKIQDDRHNNPFVQKKVYKCLFIGLSIHKYVHFDTNIKTLGHLEAKIMTISVFKIQDGRHNNPFDQR